MCTPQAAGCSPGPLQPAGVSALLRPGQARAQAGGQLRAAGEVLSSCPPASLPAHPHAGPFPATPGPVSPGHWSPRPARHPRPRLSVGPPGAQGWGGQAGRRAGLDPRSASRGWLPPRSRRRRLPDGLRAQARALEQPPPTPGPSVPQSPTTGPRPHRQRHMGPLSCGWDQGPGQLHFPAMRWASWAPARLPACNDRAGPFDVPDQRLPRPRAGPGQGFRSEKQAPPSQSLTGPWEVGCTGQPPRSASPRSASPSGPAPQGPPARQCWGAGWRQSRWEGPPARDQLWAPPGTRGRGPGGVLCRGTRPARPSATRLT